MSESDADGLERRRANLRSLLNQWDPIGVADIVDDEYDCLLAPLWQRLTGHASGGGDQRISLARAARTFWSRPRSMCRR